MSNLKKICIHWTAGSNKPNGVDLQHYHFIIDGDGKVHKGKFTPEDNINCNDGKYAQHCGGGNTGAIGVSMCGMAGYNGKLNSTKYPLTAKQCEACFKLCAELAKKYNIPIVKDNIYTHFEFGQAHSKTSSYGKIDIIYLHPYPNIEKNKIGDFIRNKIKWYLSKIG